VQDEMNQEKSDTDEVDYPVSPHHLWNQNQLPSLFCHHPVHCPPGSPHLALITSSQSPPSWSPFVAFSVFLSRFRAHLFDKSADRRETLPRDRYMGALYNASPKIREALS